MADADWKDTSDAVWKDTSDAVWFDTTFIEPAVAPFTISFTAKKPVISFTARKPSINLVVQ